MRPPSIRTLAKKTGLSKSTVALALRDDSRLRPETRQRVLDAAREAGYRPNSVMAHLLAQLRASRTATFQATLGLVNVARDREALDDINTFREWKTGCRRRAAEMGYGVDDFWLFEPDAPPDRLAQILDARGIRGLVIMGVFERGVLPAEFQRIWESYACVVVGVCAQQPGFHCASNDQFSTAAKATREVLRLGYRRPGLCLSGTLNDVLDNRFAAGFLIAQQTLPDAQKLPIFEFAPQRRREFARWMETHRPDAIITAHAELREWLHALGRDDVGLAHLDKSPGLEDWAGMEQNNESVGMAAVDLAVGQLHRNEAGVPPFAKCVLVQSTWRAGKTCRKTG